jgi:hypothetical protein
MIMCSQFRRCDTGFPIDGHPIRDSHFGDARSNTETA